MKTRSVLQTAASLAAFALLPATVAAQDPDGEEAKTEEVEETDETEEVFVFQTEEEQAIEDFEREMSEAFSIFGELFAADPLTEEQEARLPMAAKMSAVVLPEGSFGQVMQDTMEPMMNAIMGMATNDPRTELAKLSGVPAEELAELEDDDAQAALDVFDPDYAARNERLIEVTTKMIAQMFDAMEPSYREAMSRVFAVRFDEAEMTELLAFFETPVGSKFARESFRVQYDPQMMGVMEAMGPAMGEIFPTLIEDVAAMEAEFPAARSFSELSAAERSRLSGLMGKGETELEALAPEPEEEYEDEEEPVV